MREAMVRPRILADWLERRAPESWWSVDGDPTLEQSVNFPCPSDTLAGRFRALPGDLFAVVRDDADWTGEEIASENDLDAIAQRDEQGNRVLQLRWEQAGPCSEHWILCEDRDIAELATQEGGHAASAH